MGLIVANTNLQLKYKEVATPNTSPQKVNFLGEMARPCISYARHYIIAWTRFSKKKRPKAKKWSSKKG